MVDLKAHDWIEINSVELAIRAFHVPDLSPLLETMPARGDNEAMPGATGRRVFRRFVDEKEVSLGLVIQGRWGPSDEESPCLVDASGWEQGVFTNVDYLRAQLGEFEPGTVPGIWHLPDDTTKTADVQVIGIFNVRRLSCGVATAQLDLILPHGGFA